MPRRSLTRTPRSPAGVAAAIALSAAPLLSLPSCVVRVHTPLAALATTPDPAPVAVPAPDDTPWPARWGDESGRKGVVIPIDDPAPTYRGVWLGEHHHLRAATSEYDDATRLGRALAVPVGFRFRTEGPGSYLFARDPIYDGPDPHPAPAPRASDPQLFFKFVSGRRVDTWEGVDGVEIQRTWFTLYDPPDPAATRGLMLVIPGMFGTPEPVIDSVVSSWRRRGWTVLRMLSHPSRFTERLEMEVDPSDPDPAAARLADELGQRAAECAYAAEAAVEHALAQRPALRGRPTVLVGMSGGAIAAPTVHARRPDLYHALVLVAGGVDFLRINLESNYASFVDAIHLDFDPDPDANAAPTRAQIDLLDDAYLARAPLDGVSLAPRLATKPVLMIHGSSDRAVPAHLGDRLWELAGRPERWTLPVGHELVFLALPAQAPQIDKWLEGALADPADGAAP